MYLEKINKLLLSFVDQGIFSEFWYYIQEFSNYEILISIENFERENGNDTDEEIIIGKLNNMGYYDIENKLQDENWEFTAGHNFPNYRFGKMERIEAYKNFYGYSKELHTNFVDVGFLLSRKLDELFWLLIKTNKLYEAFIGTLQYHLVDEGQDCYLQFSSSTHFKDLNENYRANIFEFDVELVTNSLDFSPNFLISQNKDSDELLKKYKELIDVFRPNKLKIDLGFDELNNKLEMYESSIINGNVSELFVIKYHSLFENFIIQSFNQRKIVFNENVYDKLSEKLPWFKNEFDELENKFSKEGYKKAFRFQYLKFLFKICENIGDANSIKKLSEKYSEIKLLSGLDIYRNAVSHGEELPAHKQITAINSYRSILVLLAEFFSTVNSIILR